MMKMFFFFFLCFILSSCTNTKRNEIESDKKKLKIYYNNDNLGYLETCGCRITPLGGMDRRWNAMAFTPKESRIFVDAGNLLFKSSTVADYLAPQWFEQADGVIEAYNLLQADAVAIGENEFSLGVKKFQELAKKAQFPFLSSNIYWKNRSELFTKDSLIVEKLGKKIGIFALFHPSLRLPDELEARDPIDTARAMISKLKNQGVDMIVLLSHQGFEEDEFLAQRVKGIDLIVGAHSQSLLQTPVTEGNTLIVQLSSQGQILGMVEYDAATLPKTRTDFVVAEFNSEFDRGPPQLANPMKNLVAVTRLKMNEANQRLDAHLWAKKTGDQPPYETFLSCRDCHDTQAKFQEQKLHAASFLTLMSKGQENNLDCVKCHSVGLGKENGFHSLKDAFRDSAGNPIALEKIKQELGANLPLKDFSYRKNPEKIHPDVSKWISALKKTGVKKSFVTVQCESCHGLLPGHPFSNDKIKKITLNTCLQCHTKEQMPSWYDAKGAVKEKTLAEALKSITCPK